MPIKPQISIIVPLYNESASFPMLIERLIGVIEKTPIQVEVVLVDDGSRDNTAELVHALALSDDRFHALFLSRNHGHQSAVTAGMAVALGTEALFIIDGDLQDPPELLNSFYDEIKNGNDVVYAIRKKRKESWLKRSAYHMFYRLLKTISYIDIPLDSGDFSMISRRVADVMNKMPEESRYLRGMRTWVGFKQKGIEYERDSRVAGESKYSFKLLFKLAYNGIFNFSEAPIKFVTTMGIGTFTIATLYLLQTILKKYFIKGYVPQGFTATLFVIILFAGVQLIALGIIGEYVLRIFFQVKNRPLFIVKREILNKEIVEEKDNTRA
jgi:polyisoprenyl-phosphate glycosyltransferase